MNRILVIRGGAIGDFILTLPALKLLRDAYPYAHIEILGYKHIVALAENRFYAQGVRSIEYGALAGFFTKGAELSAELSDYFASFDLVLSYLFDPDRIFEGNVRRCGVEAFLVGSPKITGPEHAARQLARPLAELGLALTDPAATLYPSEADRESAAAGRRSVAQASCLWGERASRPVSARATRTTEDHQARCPVSPQAGRAVLPLEAPLIALHPGSGSETKNWPIEHWLHLAEWLLRNEHAASLLVIGGEADQRQLSAFRALATSGAIRFADNLPLPELAALLQNCTCFVGHDSGVSHIAAAVGTSCVLLFGSTDPAVWAPQNKHVRVIRAADGDLTQVEPELVRRAVVQELMRIGIST